MQKKPLGSCQNTSPPILQALFRDYAIAALHGCRPHQFGCSSTASLRHRLETLRIRELPSLDVPLPFVQRIHVATVPLMTVANLLRV